jgi:PAS domain-containing protein
LECRPVLPESQIVHIPPEVWLERIGYVAVQFDSSLRQATLLGFAEIVTIEELPVTQLRSLTDLLEHLNQIRQLRQMKMRVNLSQWLDHLFADGWQSLEALLATNGQNLALNFRNDSHLSDNGVRGAKLIDLELQLGNQSVVLLVGIAKAIEEKMGILVQVHPISVESYLPVQLRLSLLSEAGSVLQEVRSRTQDCYIQMKRFWVESGEKFSIQVALDEAKVTENFVI